MSTTAIANATDVRDLRSLGAEEGWVGIDRAARPGRAISRDDMRPVLRHGHLVRHGEDGVFLYATDSYLLAEVPVTGDQADLDQLPECGLIPEAMAALDRSRTKRFRIADDLVQIEGDPAFYPVRTGFDPPAFRHLFPEESSYTEADGLNMTGCNPHLMVRVAEAIGAANGVRLRFISPLRPILVTPLGTNGARGLLMPVRLDV